MPAVMMLPVVLIVVAPVMVLAVMLPVVMIAVAPVIVPAVMSPAVMIDVLPEDRAAGDGPARNLACGGDGRQLGVDDRGICRNIDIGDGEVGDVDRVTAPLAIAVVP